MVLLFSFIVFSGCQQLKLYHKPSATVNLPRWSLNVAFLLVNHLSALHNRHCTSLVNAMQWKVNMVSTRTEDKGKSITCQMLAITIYLRAFQIKRLWFHFETQSHLFELDWRLLCHKSPSPANWSLTKFKTVEGAAMCLLMQGRSGRDDAPVNKTMPKRAKLTSWYVLKGSWKLPILSCAFVKDCVFLCI